MKNHKIITKLCTITEQNPKSKKNFMKHKIETRKQQLELQLELKATRSQELIPDTE